MNNYSFDELKKIKLFSGCSDESLALLLESPYRRQDYAAGRRIFNAGDPCRSLMILTEGEVVTRMMSEEGREVLVDNLKAPILMAPAFLFSTKNVVPVDATALTDCTVWFINREAFFKFIQTEPIVLRAFLEILSNRGNFLSNKMRSFAVKGLKSRVLDYIEAHGCISSVSNAAQQLGVTRPSLSRVLADMISDELLVKDDDGYKIK